MLKCRVRKRRELAQFTNLIAGPVSINAGGTQFTTNATASLNDWLLQLPNAGPAGNGK